MAAAIKDATGVEAELIQSKGGVFDVEVDGNVIFSKKQTPENRFPTDEEILSKLS